MTAPHQNFPKAMQRQALARQRFRCASCGTAVFATGKQGADAHRFGEGAEGHHVIPHKAEGPITVENCVVLCRSCHLSAHQGGRFADISIYDDLAGRPIRDKIAEIARLYPHYK